MCSPSPPPAPDYAGAAQAQGQANLDAARASAKLNNPNLVTPYGTQSVSYGQGGKFDEAGYNQAQAQYESDFQKFSNSAGQGHWQTDPNQEGGLAPTWIPGATSGNAPTKPNKESFMSVGGDPDIATVTQQFSPEQQGLFQQQNQVKNLLGQLGISGATGLKDVIGKNLDFSGVPSAPGSADETRNKVINAMMSRVDEDTANSREQKNSQLIAAGIRPGTKAYDDSMNQITRGYNDARQSAINASGLEATRDFGMDSQRRKDAITELLSQRQTPLNEVTALMSGSQVSNPFSQAPAYNAGANVAPAPVANAFSQQAGYNTDLYNADVAQSNNNTKTAASLAMMGAMMF